MNDFNFDLREVGNYGLLHVHTLQTSNINVIVIEKKRILDSCGCM